jgi:site-specific DNA-methyltransferase (adenine-specific)
VWAELVRTGNAFVADTNGFVVGNTGYILTTTNRPERTLPHLLGVLNSKIMLYYLDQITTKMDMTGWRWLRQHVEMLPIAPLQTDNDFEAFVKATTSENQQSHKRKLDECVAKMYDLTSSELSFVREKTGDF